VISRYRVLAVAALALGAGAAVIDGTPLGQSRRIAADLAAGDRITAVTLAERIRARDPLQLVDLRDAAAYQRFHIPSATHATLDSLEEAPLARSVPIVLYADDPARAVQGWTRLKQRDYRQVAHLPGGLAEWITRVYDPALPIDATPSEREQFEHLAALSRYFGGQPRIDVPRAEIPAGLWTVGDDAGARTPVATSLLVAAIRRRGC
jgi:rhodanese-related sulfurtransferase